MVRPVRQDDALHRGSGTRCSPPWAPPLARPRRPDGTPFEAGLNTSWASAIPRSLSHFLRRSKLYREKGRLTDSLGVLGTRVLQPKPRGWPPQPCRPSPRVTERLD